MVPLVLATGAVCGLLGGTLAPLASAAPTAAATARTPLHVTEPAVQTTPAAAHPAASLRMTGLPGVGERGDHVAALQRALIARGFAIPAGATGYFGAQTRSAVAAFQRSQGWTGSGADGIPGRLTMARLSLSGPAPAAAPTAPPAPPAATGRLPRVGERGDHVAALQRALIARGFAIPAGATGYFGAQTRSAVAAFQRSQGWTGSGADGIPGRLTMARLSLSGPAPAAAAAAGTSAVRLSPAQFVQRYGPLADRASAVTGVPALVSLGQAALESGWGGSAPGFNFFGIKARPSDPAHSRVALVTTEILPTANAQAFDDVISITARPDGTYLYRVREWFRVYPSAETAFLEHGQMLARMPRYRPAFAHRNDPYRFAAAIAAGGYATDPTYTGKLHRVMRFIDGLR